MNHLLTVKTVVDYRAMQSWTTSADLRKFSKYNVIFGVNGTGKSTIASLLRNAATDATWSSGMEVLAQIDDEPPHTIAAAADPFWGSLRVFNEEYVEANLRFAEDTGSTAEPLLVLGEQRVGVEEERVAVTARLTEVAKELPTHEKARQKAETSRDRIATDTARTISEELQGTSAKYAARSYRAPAVRQLIESGVSTVDGLDVAQELRVAQAHALPECRPPAATEFLLDALFEQVREILTERALSVVIDDLANNSSWGQWVGDGVALHEDRTTCIYCGSEISGERRHALEAHFDRSLQDLQRRLAALAAKLDPLQREASQAIESLPSADLITEKFRTDYTKAHELIKTEKETFVSGIRNLSAELDRKRASMFTSLDIKAAPTVSALSLVAVADVIAKHNDYVSDIATHREKAATRVEHARVAAVQSEYRSLNEEAAEEAKATKALTDERLRLERRLKETEAVELDPLPMADRLNEDLSQLLGRADLSFVPNSRGYRIMRNGFPANNLSEGERNAISLLYFLRSLEGHDTDRQNCVVVIDDPVSSLDHNSLIGASALLWARLVEQCGQLIMLTHNFELFRAWSYQLATSRLGKNAFSLYEMRASVTVAKDGSQRRKPLLVDWPFDHHIQKRLRSEYHYLFWTVLRTVQESRANPTPEREAEAAAILPNVCRRLLEAFLAFRHPAGVGSLSEQVREIKPEVVAKEVRTRVLRFVHMYSHNEEADISKPIGRPETLENVRSVLDFMKAIDKEHFEGMCAALDLSYEPSGATSVTAAAAR